MEPNHTDKRPVIPMFADRNGTTLGYSRWGKGAVIMMPGGVPLSNQGIKYGDNLTLVLNAIGRPDPQRKVTVTFDEYHHGYSEGEGIMSLIGSPAKLGLAQILVAFFLLLFAASRRFGRIIPLMEGTRQRGEYLSSMSSLLRKAQANGVVRKELGRRFLGDIALAMGLPPTSDAEIILSIAADKHPDKLAALRELCIEATSDDDAIHETALLALAKRWHKMRKELTK